MPPIDTLTHAHGNIEERDDEEFDQQAAWAAQARRVRLYGVLLHRCLLALPDCHRELRADIQAAFRPDLAAAASRQDAAGSGA